MPQNGVFENHNLWMKLGKGAFILATGGVADLIQEEGALFAVLLLRTTDVANGCPPSYP